MAKTKSATATPTVDEVFVNTTESPLPLIDRGDVGWTDYIMAQATDKEVKVDDKTDKRCPYVNFLRRITVKEMGEVIFSQPLETRTDQDDEYGRVSTVVYGIKIEDKNTGKILEYADVADVHEKNCDHPFYKFGPQTAATRAESRAYRKALCLNIVGAEELSKKAFEKDDENTSRRQTPPANTDQAGLIKSFQVSGILKQCRDMKIDIDKFLAKYSKDGCKVVTQLSEESADKILKLLSDWFRDRNQIPEDVLKA